MSEEKLETPHGLVRARFDAVTDERAVCVLAHGAGAGFEHVHMQNLSQLLNDTGLSTYRFNFPYMEKGGGRTDPPDRCIETLSAACVAAKKHSKCTALLLAGHSFGGRMSSHFAAKMPAGLSGLVYFSFPLHPAKKPGVSRAEHLPEIVLPQLFLSGDRDALADLRLLEATLAPLANATLHTLHTADHSFKILKRTRTSQESVYEECARVLSNWISQTGVI